jgi:hypothetical protein
MAMAVLTKTTLNYQKFGNVSVGSCLFNEQSLNYFLNSQKILNIPIGTGISVNDSF